MQDEYSRLQSILSRRKDLEAKFQEQHRLLHDDRNKTAGLIYENTRELERAAFDLAARASSEAYAGSWLDRWPRQ